MIQVELNNPFFNSLVFLLIIIFNYIAVVLSVKLITNLLPCCRKLKDVFGRYIPFGWIVLLDKETKPIDLRAWATPKFNKRLWSRIYTDMPDGDKKRRKGKSKEDEDKEFAKWMAYLYIIGFSTICFYLILRSNAGPDTNDFDYNFEYVLRTGSSAMDYLIYLGPYYGWEWDPEGLRYVQVEVFGVDYDSDIDPDMTSFKPYRAATEEEEIDFLVKPDSSGYYQDAEDSD